jgi:hypothetical protein
MRPTTMVFASAVLLGCAMGPVGALAQDRTAPQAGAQQRAPLTEAPVGHRQPQGKDVLNEEMPPADSATRDLEKALAKKLNICRGC